MVLCEEKLHTQEEVKGIIMEKNKINKNDLEAYINISVYIIPMVMLVIAIKKALVNEIIATILFLIIIIGAIITFKQSIEIYNIKKRMIIKNDMVCAKAHTKKEINGDK